MTIPTQEHIETSRESWFFALLAISAMLLLSEKREIYLPQRREKGNEVGPKGDCLEG